MLAGHVCFCAAGLLPALLPALFPAFAGGVAEVPKVAFVHVSPVGDAGWTYQHDQGRLEMERALGLKARVVEGVAEGANAERVMRDLATQGHGLIFATSFGYLEPALCVAAEFPGVRIEHAGGYKTAPNLNIYNARFYEGRYLAGLLAGKSSASGVAGYVAGYVAGFPLPELVQGITAFTLGMRAANPKAQVRVIWLNAWYDPPREREAALTLINQGADLLTHHSGSRAVPQTAEEKGVKLIAYTSVRPQQDILVDNEGCERQAGGELMSDAAIAPMDWLVDGVQGSVGK